MDNISATIHDGLKKYFGFTFFKAHQEAIITNLLEGNDTFVLMPTGGGKSLCYQLPALLLNGTAIVISPLIALMKNQVDNIRNFVGDDGAAHFLNSSLNKIVLNQVRDDVLSGRTKLLYIAPESLGKEENIEMLRNINVSFYAIDEAHCISEWGHDFRPEYRKIKSFVAEIGQAPIIALTATATPKVQHDIQKTLAMLDAKVFKSSFNRENLYYEVRMASNDLNKDLVKLIKSKDKKSGIVYCLSRKTVEEVAEMLNLNGIKALPYHAGLEANIRAENQDKFLMEDVDVIVATIAFGMGIDKPDVRFVIHYNMPKSLESYYQETGRGGRDHGEGHCIAFFNPKDVIKLEKFSQGKSMSEQEINKQLLSEMVAYMDTTICRRKTLLNYFGEDYQIDNCNSCDNCKHPKKRINGLPYIKLLLTVMKNVKERFKPDHIIQILMGTENPVIKSYHHHKLEEFGEGSDMDEKFWHAVIRQSMYFGFVVKDLECYGMVSVSDKGLQYIENPYPLDIVWEKQEDDDESDETIIMGNAKGGGDEVLLSMLRDLNKKVAKQHNIPPFVIFQDTTLQDMSVYYPITLEELQNCQGVGVSGKTQKFGKPYVELIKKYVEENDITRPQDFVLKSAPNKSSLKVYIIQCIDRKMDFEDIARSKNIDFDELLTELEAIISSGTKINIKYYIDHVLDEENAERIMEYFLEEAESDDIQAAASVLNKEGIMEEEIRLVRMQFFVQYGY